MKIAVCFKIIADYNRLSQKDWEWDDRHFVDTGFVRRVFNCFDESALEMALKLSRPLGRSSDIAELTALTVDEKQGDLFLKRLLAVGYDHAVRICCKKKMDLIFNSRSISGLISAYIKQQGHQLVIFGMQGGEGDNGQTGFLAAEQLGWPCIREVTRVDRTESSGFLKVTSRIDGALLVQVVKLPMVLTMGHSLDSPYLRIPTLKQKLNAGKKKITLLSEHDLDLDDTLVFRKDKNLVGLMRPDKNKPCIFPEGKTVRDKTRHLYDQYLKGRLSS